MKLVRHRALRPPVDHESDRIFLAFFVTDRLDHIALHGRVVCALEGVELIVAHLRVGQTRAVQMRKLAFLAAVATDAEQVRRCFQRAARKHDLVADGAEAFDLAGPVELGRLAAGDVDGEDGVIAIVISARVQRFSSDG